MFSLSLRQVALLFLSALGIVLGYLLFVFTENWGGVATIFLLFSAVNTALLALICNRPWLWLFWPAVLLILGIIARHLLLLGMDILIGLSFAALFTGVHRNMANQLKFLFFPVMQPAFRTGLLVLFFGFATGIVAGIPSEQIQEKIESSIIALGNLTPTQIERIPGLGNFSGPKVTIAIINFMHTSRDRFTQSALGRSVTTEIAMERIRKECDQNEECIRRAQAELAQKLIEGQGDEAPSTAEKEQANSAAFDFFRGRFLNWSDSVNLSLLTGLLFFLLFWPLSGLFAWGLGALTYLAFRVLRRTKTLKIEKRAVEQEFFT